MNIINIRNPSRLRAALLGAVAIVAVGGVATETTLLGTTPSHAAQIASEPAPAEIAPGSFADIVARVSPAVVSVKVKITEDDVAASQDGNGAGQQPPSMPSVPKDDPMYRFFKQFGENNGPVHPNSRVGMALGSGFFISKDGYVVTNNHVVEHATTVELTLQDGRTVPATVVGTDKKTDLALLKTKTGDNYPFVPWGNSTPRVGDWVMAVGNPFGLGGTVTAGIVSARGRDIGAGPYDDFLQIDAPVNKGNSGGPTFNTQGQVVGINTAIFSPSGGSVGIGFAIPAEVAKGVIAELKANGVVSRGWLGLQIQPVSADIADSLGLKSTKGALVSEPQKGSPAADAGVKSGDVVEAVNGTAVEGPRDLSRSIAAFGPDKQVTLTVWRDGADKMIPITLGKLPGDKEAKADASAETDKTELSSLGMTLVPSSVVPGGAKDGVTIAAVDQDGIAAQNGLSVGDVILQANGKTVSRPADLTTAFSAAKQERKPVLLRVKSGDNVHYLALGANAFG
ncbi:Do family serine endopeptidase [Lichenifustis flavocetrariae]|uniref:Probable periplasmic serine endoprotease DegP-like n=1 Tax=Lichenifustis flavocetrariae TaxID=2949735 RepID=A0AA42CMN6_9HYPH|nr:Do family serine endopeptidase [Lichenifustis flavocetrariae]MCW6511776.1 Do family serine endopeptidase [Lichenifustis flavocetrariae]